MRPIRTSGGHTVAVGEIAGRYVWLDAFDRGLVSGEWRKVLSTRLTARQARRIGRALLAMADEVEPEVNL